MKTYLAGAILLIISDFFAFLLLPCRAQSAEFKVMSPDRKIICFVEVPEDGVGQAIFNYSIRYKSKDVIIPSSFNLEIDSIMFSGDNVVEKSTRESVKNSWENYFGEKRMIPDKFHQLSLQLRRGSQRIIVYCRVYNEGVAFSYEIPGDGSRKTINVTDEYFTFKFPSDYMCWSANRAQAVYEHIPISQLKEGSERPFVVECGNGLIVALAEACLVDFARMKFDPEISEGIGVRTRLHGPVMLSQPLRSPWRVVMIAETPSQLLEQNYIIQNLNPPSAIKDISWIMPGKALRDGTLTTKGAKACIDFVASHGMQYVEFDAGWYGPENDDASDATSVNLDSKRSKGPFDLQEIIRYGKDKGVGILLYVNHKALERQLDILLPLYRDWGIAGIKFGFVNVGDQKWTSWLHEAVKKCADYNLVVDIHDEYRPTGFSRTYPNLLTQEGIRGDEESIPNSHTLITAFTRMLAGAADNTVCYYAERVTSKMGSHASQLAKSVCLFSPLQFFYWYDRPAQAPDKQDGLWGKTNVIGDEPELDFFDKVPTVWDETKVLQGEIGQNIIIARRKGESWFLGGMTGDKPLSSRITFDFLEPGITYKARIFYDDPSVNTRTNVGIIELKVSRKSKYDLKINANNGVAMYLIPEKL